MTALTDYRRVEHRVGVSEEDVNSSDIEEYIEDAQATIEGDTAQTYAEGNDNFNLARAACTDLAAAYALIRVLGGSYAGLGFNEEEIELGTQQSTKIQLINKYLGRANNAIAILKRETSVIYAISTTL
ncbi:MAG: hypothetical protein U9N01_04575 [Euryarchaeota archaeon]|nr:hypothetical protein [Euryarchaeota archaeon]